MTSAPPIHPAIAGGAPWQHAVCEYIDLLRAHYGDRLHAVVLFGSRARGDAVEDESDVDLLVVLEGEFDLKAEQKAVFDLERQVDESYEYWLFSLVASVYEYRRQMLPLYMNVRREGIELWPYKPKQMREERAEYGKPGREELEIVLRLAREALRDAAFNLEHHGFRSAAGRAYYVMFHAATALLLSDGFAFSKHQGVIEGFRMHFIRTGRLPPELSDAIGRAFRVRNIADYSYREDVSADEAREVVSLAGDFLARSEDYLGLKP